MQLVSTLDGKMIDYDYSMPRLIIEAHNSFGKNMQKHYH